MCCSPAEAFPRPPVDFGERVRELGVTDLCEVRSYREELAEKPVGVLVAPPLPGRVRVGEIERHAERRQDTLVIAELLAAVRRRRPERTHGEGAVHCLDCRLHRGGATVRDRKGDAESALSFDERRDACLRLPTPGDHGVELPCL